MALPVRCKLSRNVIIWILAVLVTLTSAVWQKKSGPTYPFSFDAEIGGMEISGELARSNSINSDLPVQIKVAELEAADPGISGVLVLRNYPSKDEPWQREAMTYNSATGQLEAGFNHPDMASKVEYYVELTHKDQVIRIPSHEAAVSRFKGDVPAAILIIHIFCMFFGMLWASRAGFEALVSGPSIFKLSLITFGLLFVGGLIMGPIVQKYAFNAYWTGFPFGYDLTDNKLAIAVVAWLIAVLAARGGSRVNPKGRWFVVAAMVVVLVVFSIPHSIHGSTFDYDTGEHIQVGMNYR